MRIDDDGKDGGRGLRENSDNLLKFVNQLGSGGTVTAEAPIEIRLRTVLRVAAWLCLAGIAFATLAPIGWRPTTSFSPSVERFTAFALAGALFAAGYPRYLWASAILIIGAAVTFESLQLLEATRHGRVFDAAVKIVGGVSGLTAGWVLAWLLRRLR
ncbi:hypothetical protein [Rhodopseudomonas sp. B29]|uniref:hypothetical protein n=1 Tax=Rhodopseudomonas sp. B29 TaxID=95607 RepID=UPI001FCBC6C5|nr:hypothetical protein [Rhodopseudomonas sp. B29]